MIIGVTGKYCAGKSIVSGLLQESGFREIDADKVGHIVLEEKKEQIIDNFGKQILGQNGLVDRRKLGRIVFKSRKKRKKLEAILHPIMRKKIMDIIDQPAGNYIINAALLFQMKLQLLCDWVIFVTAPFWQRFKRARQRDKLPLIQVYRRFFSQKKISTKLNAGGVDIYYVCNNGSIDEFKNRLKEILAVREIREA
jgi:dephospho-CoA kinase